MNHEEFFNEIESVTLEPSVITASIRKNYSQLKPILTQIGVIITEENLHQIILINYSTMSDLLDDFMKRCQSLIANPDSFLRISFSQLDNTNFFINNLLSPPAVSKNIYYPLNTGLSYTYPSHYDSSRKKVFLQQQQDIYLKQLHNEQV
jgi:hypothetical protein